MYFIGIDAHKQCLVLHVADAQGKRVDRARIACEDTEAFRRFLRRWSPCAATVEACNLADWIAPIAREECERFVLAHPAKVKLIAQTVKKTDRVDARALAELLARDFVPPAYLPTQAERQDRSLVRTSQWLAKEIRRAKARIRSVLNRHNLAGQAPRGLFSKSGREWLRSLALGAGESLEISTALGALESSEKERRRAARLIAGRAGELPEARLLESLPGVGAMTSLALISILGDWRRFGSLRQVAAFVGLCPSVDQSGGRCHLGHITRKGDGLVRGLLVEASWKAVRRDAGMRGLFERIARHRGRKIAIVAVARHLVRIAVSMLRAGASYNKQTAALGEGASRGGPV
jgi:transposase